MSLQGASDTNVLGDASVASNKTHMNRVSHQNIIDDGLVEDDFTKVQTGLKLAESRKRKDSKLLAVTLAKCIPSGSLNVLGYLLKQEEAPLTRVSPELIQQCPAEKISEVLQILVDSGWDINQHDASPGGGNGKCLLQHICNNEDLVRWCLAHGANVEDIDIDPYYNPPLLECVARSGTVSTFKLLQSHGVSRCEHRYKNIIANTILGTNNTPNSTPSC